MISISFQSYCKYRTCLHHPGKAQARICEQTKKQMKICSPLFLKVPCGRQKPLSGFTIQPCQHTLPRASMYVCISFLLQNNHLLLINTSKVNLITFVSRRYKGTVASWAHRILDENRSWLGVLWRRQTAGCMECKVLEPFPNFQSVLSL